MRAIRTAALLLTLAAAAIVLTAAPAAAHGNPGLDPTNYEVRVRALTPAVAGLAVRTVDLGQHLELTNDTTDPVEVLAADGEVQVRVEPGATGRWHEHRAVWDGAEPPVVRRDRDHSHVVRTWEFELRQGGRAVVVTGDILWVPPPSPWSWVAVAAGLGLALVLASRARRWAGSVAVALVLSAAATALLLFGRFGATTESAGTKLGAAVYGTAGVVLAAIALLWLLRARDPAAATPAVLVAGVVIVIAGGLAHLGLLTHSQLPTDLPAWLARAAVATALGLGAGLVVAAALRLRTAPAGRRPLSAPR